MTLQPGIQTDSLVARKLWRADVVSDPETGEHYIAQLDEKVPLPAFSTDVAEAERIVEFLESKGWVFRVKNIPEDDQYKACFIKEDNRTYRFAKADTIPMVICEAAMAVINGTNLK
jgi:hypothetical protein